MILRTPTFAAVCTPAYNSPSPVDMNISGASRLPRKVPSTGMRESKKMPPAASHTPETMIGRVPVRMNIFVATAEPNPMPTVSGRYETPVRSGE